MGYEDFLLEIRTLRKANTELRQRIRDLEEKPILEVISV